MKKRFQINQTLKIDGVKYRAGDVAEEGEIPAGNVESMLRLGQCVELQPDGNPVPPPPLPPDEQPLPPEPADETDTPKIVLQLDGGTQHTTAAIGTLRDLAPSGPLVGPPGEVPTQAPEQPKVEQKQPDPKRKK